MQFFLLDFLDTMKTLVVFIFNLVLAVRFFLLQLYNYLIFLLKDSIFLINDFKVTYRQPVTVNFTVINDKVKGFTSNLTITTSATISKLLFYIKAKTAEKENGEKEFINTVIDGEKALEGRQSNFLIGFVIDWLLASCTFLNKPCAKSFTFPAPKVSFKLNL